MPAESLKSRYPSRLEGLVWIRLGFSSDFPQELGLYAWAFISIPNPQIGLVEMLRPCISPSGAERRRLPCWIRNHFHFSSKISVIQHCPQGGDVWSVARLRRAERVSIRSSFRNPAKRLTVRSRAPYRPALPGNSMTGWKSFPRLSRRLPLFQLELPDGR